MVKDTASKAGGQEQTEAENKGETKEQEPHNPEKRHWIKSDNRLQPPASSRNGTASAEQIDLKDYHKKNSLEGNIDHKHPETVSPPEVPSRLSLDDLQKWPQYRVWQKSNLVDACEISLPLSTTSSTISETIPEQVQLPLGNSLEQLSLNPHEIPLPQPTSQKKRPRRSATMQPALVKRKPKKAPSPPQPEGSPETNAYRAYIRDHFDRNDDSPLHLINTACTETRQLWGSRVVFYDHLMIPQSQPPMRQEPWKNHHFPPSYDEFYTEMRGVPEGCVQRVILVEDMTPSLIDLLGATFQISPHVFEEHLHGSGYGNQQERRLDSDAWYNSHYSHECSSFTWYRPVIPLIPMPPRSRIKLVTNRKLVVPCVIKGCKRHKLNLSLVPNIWRRHLELCPDPGVNYKGSEAEYPIGWEQKATIWTRDLNNCKFVIIFLDPLPHIIDKDMSADNQQVQTEIRRDDRTKISQTYLVGTSNQQMLTENTFQTTLSRSYWPSNNRKAAGPRNLMSRSPPSTVLEEPEEKHVPQHPLGSTVPETSSDPEPILSEMLEPSLAAIHTLKRPSAPTAFEEASVTPGLNQSQTTGTQIDSPTDRISLSDLRRRNTAEGMDDAPPMAQSQEATRKSNRTHHSSRFFQPRYPERNEETQDSESHGLFVPYQPVRNRSSSTPSYGNTSPVFQMSKTIENPNLLSTLDEFERFMQLPGKGKEKQNDYFGALLRAVHDDTLGLMTIIRVSLRRIREGTLNEDLMQKRVTFWRILLYQLTSSLAEFDQQLQDFAHFAHDLDVQTFSSDERSELPSEKIAKSTREMLQGCINLVEKSSDSLRAEMQILDSRRSIAEAESISKLTELAFIFIPLSFVASTFSMQIHELDGGVSLYLFVVVAIAFVIMAYAIRLSIRSSSVLDLKTKTVDRIREDSHLNYNEPIPTHTFLAWIGTAAFSGLQSATKYFIRVLAPFVLVSAIIAAILSPIVLLWLRGIDKGFTAVITILLLLLDGILVFPVITNSADKFKIEYRALFREVQKHLEEKSRQREKAKRKLKKRTGNDLEALSVEDIHGSDDSST
ncbi:hypothetical protein BS50DRAFT_401893 [Corynespora cassiicola Philippines]|uniref:Cora-domain-containing protein n=1 Tax=Corynespora cassiicola Philippines TaxID=1448308 RepID=A0A2T2NKI7_CORCC|nr:hypothetical protein BS50DRAFT_401893 [Corynespora cassiicola Philippines]